MRAFFAVPLPADLRQSLGALQSEWGRKTGGIRWVRTDSLHVTLRFLGAIEPPTAAALGAGLGARPPAVPPFLLEVRGAGCFPDARAPRVVWVGIGRGAGELEVLSRHLEEAIRGVGLPEEGRPFSPHLTLGRVRGRPDRELASLCRSVADRTWGEFRVEEFLLMESQLTPEGARHREVARFPLADG